MNVPQPTPFVAKIPASTPFIGPEALQRAMGRSFDLRLGANESLFGASPHAIEAMRDAVVNGHLYGDPEGYELRVAIANHHGCEAENVALASGIDELLMLFARAFLSPGDSVTTTRGSYPTFEYAVRSVGGQFNYAEYKEGKIDLELLLDLSRTSRLLYIANPDNPSGSWQNLASLETDSDTLVLLDEAYHDFAPNVGTTHEIQENIVRLRTFSKAHGMAGIRIGYALCHSTHVKTLDKLRMHFGVSIVAQAGALASMRDPDHVARVVQETNRVKAWMAERLPVLESFTNFVLIDRGNSRRAEQTLLDLRSKGVFVRKPSLPPFDHSIRVTISRQADMEEFERRFREID